MKSLTTPLIPQRPAASLSHVEFRAGTVSIAETLGNLVARLLRPGAPLLGGGGPASREPVTGLSLQELNRGRLCRLENSDGAEEVHVLNGVVWLTDTPTTGDVILRPLDSHRFSGRWPVVIEALEDASLVITRRRS